jgi:hypothetical protein
MKIACVMVTENRAPIWGIGLASFLSQYHSDRHLVVVLPAEEEAAYRCAAAGFGGHPYMDRVVHLCIKDEATVPQKLDIGCKAAWDFGADLVAIMDDDDWSPPDRLDHTAVQAWDQQPTYASYTRGWFVNLRTLRGELVRTTPHHLWGGTLTFNQAAWECVGGFSDKPFPGQDRAFMRRLSDMPHSLEYHLRSGRGAEPVAFSHGKNVATWLKSRGTQMEGVFKKWMPELVLVEIKRCQQLMIDTRTYPPQPEK